MQCDDIMTQKPYFLRLEQPACEAAAQMRVQNVSVLPVCDDQQKVVGALTDRDIVLRMVADKLSMDTPVADLMSQEVFACSTHDDAACARDLMEAYEVERLVCLDDAGRLAGMVGMAQLV